jgi:hypothetical protein
MPSEGPSGTEFDGTVDLRVGRERCNGTAVSFAGACYYEKDWSRMQKAEGKFAVGLRLAGGDQQLFPYCVVLAVLKNEANFFFFLLSLLSCFFTTSETTRGVHLLMGKEFEYVF